MPNVHGIEFNSNQSELVKDLIRELLKDGDCAVYALHNMKPSGELRMASTPPNPGPRRAHGVFLRIRPGLKEATIVRPMNAKAGEKFTKVSKLTQAQNLETIRIWRKETRPRGVPAVRTRPGSNKTPPDGLSAANQLPL
jgi:hypothetical protein